MERGIFDSLVEADANGTTLSNDELARKTDIDPVLLSAMLSDRGNARHDLLTRLQSDYCGTIRLLT